MTVEATAMETAPETGIAPVVMPESPIPQAETIQEPEVEVSDTPESAPTPERTDIAIYQDLLAKHEADPNYSMNDEEMEAFGNVQDKIANNEIEAPEPKAKGEDPTQEVKEEVKPEAETSKETAPTDTSDMTKAQADHIQAVMTKVGAKDITELPEKVEGLINQMKTSGGKLGGERAQLQQEVDKNNNFMQGIASRDQRAYSHFKKLTGVDLNALTASSQGENSSQVPSTETDFGDPDEYIDPAMAKQFQLLKQEMNSLKQDNASLKSKDVGREQEFQNENARSAYVSDVVSLLNKHGADFGIDASEGEALAKFYWSPEGAKTAVHPRFQKMHELITFANQKGTGLPLKDAHVLWQHENGIYSQNLINATKQGQKEATYMESPNAAISNRQGKTKTNVPNPHITEDMVNAMEKGDLSVISDDILESWADENGNFIRSKVPQKFHKQAFG